MIQRKSSKQVKAIDKFIYENYPIHGADFCAQELCESLQYIKVRIKVCKVGKMKEIRSEHDMRQRIDYLIGLNKELRLENMKLIVNKMKLKNEGLFDKFSEKDKKEILEYYNNKIINDPPPYRNKSSFQHLH